MSKRLSGWTAVITAFAVSSLLSGVLRTPKPIDGLSYTQGWLPFTLTTVATAGFALLGVSYGVLKLGKRLRRPTITRNPVIVWSDPIQFLSFVSMNLILHVVGRFARYATGYSIDLSGVLMEMAMSLGLVVGMIVSIKVYSK